MRGRTLSIVALVALSALALGVSCTPQTFQVTTTEDAPDAAPGDGVCATATGACSLRAAVQEANALPGKQVVKLQAETYLLSQAGAGEDDAASGDLDIRGPLKLVGKGATRTVIHGMDDDRVLHVHAAPVGQPRDEVIVNHLRIQGGRARGAGMLGMGGGILNQGCVKMRWGIVQANRADANGGGIYNAPGAVFDLFQSTASHNESGQHGGGVANEGDLSVTSSTLSLNYAAGEGGGIYQGDVGQATVLFDTLYLNETSSEGSALGGELTNLSLGGTILGSGAGQIVCSSSPVTLDGNVSSDDSCGLGLTSKEGVAVDLAALAAYGGAMTTANPVRQEREFEDVTLDGGGSCPAGQWGEIRELPSLTCKIGAVVTPLPQLTLVTGDLYVAMAGVDALVIDTHTNAIKAQIPVADAWDVAVDHFGTRVFLSQPSTDRVMVADASTYLVIASYTVGDEPREIALNPASTHLYVVNAGDDTISVVDLAALTTLTYPGSLPALPSPSNLAVRPQGNVAYATLLGAPDVHSLTHPTATPANAMAVGDGQRAVAFNPKGSYAYAVNHAGGVGEVYEIEALTETWTDTIALTSDWLEDIVFDPSGAQLYVSDLDENVHVIDANTKTLTASTAGIGSRIAVHHTLPKLWGTRTTGAAGVGIMDTGTNAFVTTIATTGLPNNLAVKP